LRLVGAVVSEDGLHQFCIGQSGRLGSGTGLLRWSARDPKRPEEPSPLHTLFFAPYPEQPQVSHSPSRREFSPNESSPWECPQGRQSGIVLLGTVPLRHFRYSRQYACYAAISLLASTNRTNTVDPKKSSLSVTNGHAVFQSSSNRFCSMRTVRPGEQETTTG